MNKLISKIQTIEIIKTVFNNEQKNCKLSIQQEHLKFEFPNDLGVKHFYYFDNLFQILANKIGAKISKDKNTLNFKLSYSEIKTIKINASYLYENYYVLNLLLEDSQNNYIATIDITKLEQFKILKEILKQEFKSYDENFVDCKQFESDFSSEIFKIASIYNQDHRYLQTINIENFENHFHLIYTLHVLQFTISNIKYEQRFLDFITKTDYIKNIINSAINLFENSKVSQIETSIDLQVYINYRSSL